MSGLLRLYPPAWRARYGDEMAALLEARPIGWSDRLDLVRGALDAWLHPGKRSRAPAAAALVGGGLWTVAAAALVLQPAPPDWPGYITETLPLTLVASVSLFVATVGCGLRLDNDGGRATRIAAVVAVVGYMAWAVTLALALFGGVPSALLAAAQTVAMISTTLIGSRLVLAGDQPVGVLLVTGAVAMLIPWTAGWLAFGTAWTAIGIALWVELSTRAGPAGLAG